MKIVRVISGGQTGADIGGLNAAALLGIETGGWAPKGWLTENGPDKKMLQEFGLEEASVSGYPYRTEQNIIHSNFTVLLAAKLDGGSKLTWKLANMHDKVIYHFQMSQQVMWHKTTKRTASIRLAVISVKSDLRYSGFNQFARLTCNVAGNRESKSPGIHDLTVELMLEFVKAFNGKLGE